MNPILLKLGFSVIVAALACVAAYRTARRLQASPEIPLSRFDGSGITICCICMEQLSSADERRLVSLPCKHKFHNCCIKEVFSRQLQGGSCPLCRKRVDSSLVASVLQRSDF